MRCGIYYGNKLFSFIIYNLDFIENVHMLKLKLADW